MWFLFPLLQDMPIHEHHLNNSEVLYDLDCVILKYGKYTVCSLLEIILNKISCFDLSIVHPNTVTWMPFKTKMRFKKLFCFKVCIFYLLSPIKFAFKNLLADLFITGTHIFNFCLKFSHFLPCTHFKFVSHSSLSSL